MKSELYISEALSEEIRLRIVVLLQDAVLCVKCITASLEFPQPTVSRHLGILKRSGLLKSERGGVRTYYSLNFNGDFSSLKRKLTLAYQKELNEIEPYALDRKRLMELAQNDYDDDCVIPNTKNEDRRKKKRRKKKTGKK